MNTFYLLYGGNTKIKTKRSKNGKTTINQAQVIYLLKLRG